MVRMSQLAKRRKQHVQVFLAGEASCVDEQPRALAQSQLAAEGRRPSTRSEYFEIDAEGANDDALDVPIQQPPSHELARRQNDIATAIE